MKNPQHDNESTLPHRQSTRRGTRESGSCAMLGRPQRRRGRANSEAAPRRRRDRRRCVTPRAARATASRQTARRRCVRRRPATPGNNRSGTESARVFSFGQSRRCTFVVASESSFLKYTFGFFVRLLFRCSVHLRNSSRSRIGDDLSCTKRTNTLDGLFGSPQQEKKLEIPHLFVVLYICQC